MRALVAVAAVAAMILACSDDPNPTLGPAFDLAEEPPKPDPGEPAGTCPNNFKLSPSKIAFKATRMVGRNPADDNVDGYICYLITKDPVLDDAGNLKSEGIAVLIDNNKSPEEVGKCPVTFTATAVFGAEEDYNGNSVVCKVQAEDVGLVVVDDNDS